MIKPIPYEDLFLFKRVALPLVILGSFPSLIDLSPAMTATCFLILTCGPFFLLRKPDFFHPLCMISVMYALAMPIPVLFLKYYSAPVWRTILRADIAQALIWSYRGYACLFLGYLVAGMWFSRKKMIRAIAKSRDAEEFSGLITFAKWTGILALTGGGLKIIADGGVTPVFMETRLTGEISTLRQILHYIQMLVYPFMTIYVTLRWRNIRIKKIDLIFYLLLALQVVFIIGAGAKLYVFSLFVSAALAAWFLSIKMSIRQLIAVLVVAFSIYLTFALITNYRELARDTYNGDSDDILTTFQTQAQIFLKAIEITTYKQKSAIGYDYETSISILDRLALISSLSKVIEFSRGSPPYENALESFLVPAYAVLPRSIFPEKPSFFDSGEFAKFFGWSFGGVSVTLIGSLYWAWGYWGICFGMAFFGSLLSYFEIKAKEISFRGGMYAVLLVELVLYLLEVGGTFQSIILDISRAWLLMWLLFFVYRLFGKKAVPKSFVMKIR